VLIQGTPYVASYNNSDGAFYLQGGFADPYGVPIGGMIDYAGATAPNSAFVLPAGQAISRTTYARAFTLMGTTFGAGDGSTTFNVPDLRGRVVAALDNLNGSAASRIGTVATDSGTITGATLGSAGGSATHAQTVSEMATHTPSGSVSISGTSAIITTDGSTGIQSGASAWFRGLGTAPNVTGSFTGNSIGSGATAAILQPTIMLGKVLRVI